MTKLKAVIPVAGLGMHMLPATKAIPKEMLPVVDKPMIQYIVDECVAAGIKEIVLVTHASKNAVENHFDTSYELEALLEARVKRQVLSEVQSICPPGVTIMNVRQPQPLGLANSILCARPMLHDDAFVVILPDVLLDDSTADPLRYNLAAMVARFEETGRSQVLAHRMPEADLSEYSVIKTQDVMDNPGQTSQITDFVEKPEMHRRWVQILPRWDATCSLLTSGPNWKISNRVHGTATSSPMPLPILLKNSRLMHIF